MSSLARRLLLMAAAGAVVVSPAATVAVSPLWGRAGVTSYTAVSSAGTPASVQWYDGDPAAGGTAISGATALTYAPVAGFGTDALYCVCDGVKSGAAATVAGVWVSDAAASAGAGASSFTPTNLPAKRGQFFVLARFQIGGGGLTGLSVGGGAISDLVATNYGSGSRWATWSRVTGISGANPAVAWTAGQSNNNVMLWQVVGYGQTLAEAYDGTLDTASANTDLTIALDSGLGAVLVGGSRATNFTAGGVTVSFLAANTLAAATRLSDVAGALTITANRNPANSAADRQLGAIRLAPTGTPVVGDLSLAALHPILF